MYHQYHCNSFVAPTHHFGQYVQVEPHYNLMQMLKLYQESQPGLWVYALYYWILTTENDIILLY